MKKMKQTKKVTALLTAWLLFVMVAGPVRAAAFTEPATVFYGKVLAVGTSGSPQRLSQGELTWHVRLPDGSDVALRTSLFALNEGEFSYRLDIPHRALALGLVLDSTLNAVPLSALSTTQAHMDIRVDGQPALMMGPAGSTFDLHQAQRASAYRLDLAIAREPLDTDGDGMPDWWEDRYGLDKQAAADAQLDPDGDGVSSFDEFLQGLDPTQDSDLPLLATRELMVYADGTTGLLLQTLDQDSPADQLNYTLLRAPASGQLLLRNRYDVPGAADQLLAAGATFTQSDIDQGLLIFTYDEDGETPVPFELSVRDENPAHPAAEGTVLLFPYRPAADLADPEVVAPEWVQLAGATRLVDEMAADEDRRLKNYLLSRTAGFEVRDGSHLYRGVVMSSPSAGLDAAGYADGYVANYGPDLRQILIGGAGSDTLTGGMESDVLVGGPGHDALRGNGGADWFVWQHAQSGRDTVEDFTLTDQDVLDVSALVVSGGAFAGDYLRLDDTVSPPELRVDANGDGSGFDDFIIELPGLAIDTVDLAYLVENGHLLIDGLNVKPRVTVLVENGTASENGPTAGSFRLERTGSLSEDLWVSIQLDGSAENGRDFSSIAAAVRIPAGASGVSVPVIPFVDSETEADETVELVLLDAAGYLPGLVSRASVIIEDLRVIVEIEALEPVAIQESLVPGVFLVKRSAILDRSVLVRLAITGSAESGVDYQPIVGYVNLAPYQTSALVLVTPLAGAALMPGGESVLATIQPDASYKVGPESGARVAVILKQENLADWQQRNVPDFEGSLEEFAAADSGNHGISHLLRYAYGMDMDNPDPARLPRFYLRDGHLTVDLYRNPAATDLEYRIAVSSDLAGWDDSAASVEEVERPEAQSEPGATRFQARETTDTVEKLFMVIEIRKKP